MDCHLNQSVNNKKIKTSKMPAKFRKNTFKTLFEENRIKSDEQFYKAQRKRQNQRLLDGFVKPTVPAEDDKTNSEIWDKEALASSGSSPRGHRGDAKVYIRVVKGSVVDVIKWPSKYMPRESELLKELSNIQRAELRIEKASREFAEWWADLGSNSTEEEKEINTETIKKMFAVEFDEHVTRALAIVPHELMCVPPSIANMTCQPQASVSATVKRQVKCDVIAEEQEKKIQGFDQKLPLELTFIPPDNKTKEMWVDIKAAPKELDDMTTVWDGITNLKSSQDFYEWLGDNGMGIPPFLKEHFEGGNVEAPVCTADLMHHHQKLSHTLIPVLVSHDHSSQDLRKNLLNNTPA